MKEYYTRVFPIDNQRLETIKSYIDENITGSLKIRLLAKKFGYSTSTLKRHFTKCYNQPLHQYILVHRMELAKKILFEENCSITDIGVKVGYINRSSFNRAFAKYFGCSPSELVKKIDKMTI